MITKINSHYAVLNNVILATDENIHEMLDGKRDYLHFAKLDFVMDGSMELSVKVGDDILQLPIIKISFEVQSNKDYQWMINKPEAEFLVDK